MFHNAKELIVVQNITTYIWLVKWTYSLYHLVLTKVILTKYTNGFKKLLQRKHGLKIISILQIHINYKKMSELTLLLPLVGSSLSAKEVGVYEVKNDIHDAGRGMHPDGGGAGTWFKDTWGLGIEKLEQDEEHIAGGASHTRAWLQLKGRTCRQGDIWGPDMQTFKR